MPSAGESSRCFASSGTAGPGVIPERSRTRAAIPSRAKARRPPSRGGGARYATALIARVRDLRCPQLAQAENPRANLGVWAFDDDDVLSSSKTLRDLAVGASAAT